MKDSTNDGGPAFPRVSSYRDGDNGDYHTVVESAGGMTLRDYFAAKALQAIISNSDTMRNLSNFAVKQGNSAITQGELYSSAAYEYADAMLAAREKGSK